MATEAWAFEWPYASDALLPRLGARWTTAWIARDWRKPHSISAALNDNATARIFEDGVHRRVVNVNVYMCGRTRECGDAGGGTHGLLERLLPLLDATNICRTEPVE